MAKKHSKKRQQGDSRCQPRSTSEEGVRNSSPRDTLKGVRPSLWSRVKLFRTPSPHKSFRRTYREDYVRELNVPGMGQHIYEAFVVFFGNWKIFGGLVVLATVLMALAMGALTETVAVFAVLIFLMIWLVTIFEVRHLMAGHKVTLRDGLYNAMTPLMSSLVVFVVAVVESVPIMLVMMGYTVAMRTDFLTMPFYALLFWGVVGLMLLLSGYLLSSSLIALVAVSAPGVYPWKALTTASELMVGRRVRFILRLIALILVLGVIWAVVVLPLSALKLPMEVLSVVMALLGCFSAVYATIYLYLYYRYLLEA